MKRVALINPGTNPQYAVQEPLHLGFIASYLEQNGVEVRLIDELAGQDVYRELSEYHPQVVGITATTPLARDAYRIADRCREIGLLTVMGGVHASTLPQEALQHADVVVVGEGEIAMLDIVKGGIASGIVTRPYIRDIDRVPPPARHLMQMDFYLRSKDRIPGTYLYFVPQGARVAAILTSRGCPYSCIFCHNSWRGTPYRSHSPERVISEIRRLIREYRIGYLFFIEDNFFADKGRVTKICEMMIAEGIRLAWGANARVDGVDPGILQVAKRAGCKQVTFGFESGSQKVLDVLNKKTTVEQNMRAIELCNKVGIIPQGTVMVGNPTETVEDVRETQQFLRQAKIQSVGVCITTPYPGTVLWDWCREHNLVPPNFSWSDLDYHQVAIPACDTMSPEDIKRLQIESDQIMAEKPTALPDFIREILKPANIRKAARHPSSAVSALIRRLRKGVRF